jgi:predicted DNA-binding transcriptional regulator AlpA
MATPRDSILRLPSVMEATGLSRTTIWRLESRGQFPARRRLGPQAIGWLLKDVEEWITTRVKAESASPNTDISTD